VVVIAEEALGIAVVAAVAIALHAVIQRMRAYDRFSAHNDVAGFLLAVVGVVYAVILGFVVIIVWERYTATEGYVQDEASAVAGVYRLSAGLPSAVRAVVRADMRAYIDEVLDREWPLLENGEGVGASKLLEDATYRAITFSPTTMRESNIQEATITELQAAFDARRMRLAQVAPSVKPILWVALLIGAAVTLGFTFLFGTKNRGAQLVMTGALVTIMALLFVVVMEFDTPFKGSVAVQPTVWADLQQRLPEIR
jgi:hypothetical protein